MLLLEGMRVSACRIYILREVFPRSLSHGTFSNRLGLSQVGIVVCGEHAGMEKGYYKLLLSEHIAYGGD